MIELISKLQVSINQRFDHLTMLTIDSEDMATLVKDDEKKRNMVRNFRIIKASEKNRILEETKCINLLGKLNRKLSKTQIIVCESMITNCINQYLNTEYLVRKNGQPEDLIDVFIYYYEKIKAYSKVRQMTVIRNCNLLQELNFISENLNFFLSNVQESMRCLYESQKNKFFNLLKQQNRTISPERRINDQEQEERFDFTGSLKGKKKRQLQTYCFELSKLLNLEHVYIDYYYFNSMDVQKRKRMMESNYLKRNVVIRKVMQAYEKEYASYKMKKLQRRKGQSEKQFFPEGSQVQTIVE